MTRIRSARPRFLVLAVAAAFAACLASPRPARAEQHQAARGNPFHIAGHLLAPVGNAFGFLVVEPFFWVIDNVPLIFDLD